mgnify:CR=1 FL=1
MEQNEQLIEITETLQKTIRVYAATPEDAMSRVREAYDNGGIVLGADDFVGVTFGQTFDEQDRAAPPKRRDRGDR